MTAVRPGVGVADLVEIYSEDLGGVVRSMAGLRDVRLHDLRHSFASIGVLGGASMPIIGALLGHNAATTQRYAHLSDDPLRAASEAVGSHIAAARNQAPRRAVVNFRK